MKISHLVYTALTTTVLLSSNPYASQITPFAGDRTNPINKTTVQPNERMDQKTFWERQEFLESKLPDERRGKPVAPAEAADNPALNANAPAAPVAPVIFKCPESFTPPEVEALNNLIKTAPENEKSVIANSTLHLGNNDWKIHVEVYNTQKLSSKAMGKGWYAKKLNQLLQGEEKGWLGTYQNTWQLISRTAGDHTCKYVLKANSKIEYKYGFLTLLDPAIKLNK